MILYGIVFIVALFFAFCADLCQRETVVPISAVTSTNGWRHDMLAQTATAKGARNAFIVLSALSLILLSGLRYDTGYDYLYSYVPSLDATRAGYESHYDPLFNFIITVFAQFDSNQWFFASMAVYTVGMTYYALCKQSKYVMVPIALYIASFTYLRAFCFVAQYVSIATFFVGSVFLLQRKYVKALVFLILGCMLHLSGLVVVPLFLLFLISNRTMLIVSILLPVFSLVGQSTIRILAERFSVNTRFDYYISSHYDSAYSDPRLTLINLAIFLLFILIWCMAKQTIASDKRAHWYLLAQSFALAFSFVQPVFPVGYRFVWYFMIVQCVSIPYLLKYIMQGSIYYCCIALIILCFTVWMVLFQIPGPSEVIPYHPVFAPTSSY